MASLYAEYFHLWARTESWRRESLIQVARAGALDPDELFPRDWGTLIRLLGEVSTGTAAMGAYAYVQITSAAMRAKLLVKLAQTRSMTIGGYTSEKLEEQIKKEVSEAADLFEDGLRCAPSWVLEHRFSVVDPRSTMGLKVQEQLREMRRRIHPRRHEPIVGPVGKLCGQQLARLAVWFDPASC